MISDKYEAMNAMYDSLNDCVNKMLDDINDAKKVVSKMDSNDHWDGDAYNVYKNKFVDMTQNFGAYCNELLTLNNLIKEAVAKYKEVDAKVAEELNI